MAGVERVRDELVTVQGWVVKHNWCWLKQEVKVGSHRDAATWIPVTGQRSVRIVVGVGLVLTSRTESTDDVVGVRGTVTVLNNHPNAGVAVGVGRVASNLEHLSQGAVQQSGRHRVT